MARLVAISRCMAELELVRNAQMVSPTAFGLIGELDWLEELHRLLYGAEKEQQNAGIIYLTPLKGETR